MKTPRHILVVRLSALGDVAMTVPVLRVFSQTYPEVKLTVVSRAFYKPLFRDIKNLQFLEADVYGTHKGFGLLKLAKEAKTLGVDAVADLHNVIRSKILTGYFSLRGIKTETIDKGRAEKKALTKNPEQLKRLKSTHQRYADVFEALGFPLYLTTHVYPPKKELTPQLHDLIGKHTKKMIGIAPFAAYKSKMYPLELMKEVVYNLNEDNLYKIFLFGGGKKEEQFLDTWENQFENVTNVAGKFNFETELTLLSNLDLMLSMDSGNGHLAALYNVPVVTLWGVTHPYAGFTPFNQPNEHQLVANRGQYPLIPTSVYGNKFPEGYEDSMQSIPVETVLHKIKEVI
ncbi:glycosyltransferase family 9 protein [Marinirhabdus gelatinilytica]|uniref:ADP-heptose:LPS heptosyltransferase n=1 Tax=Marinirhabdus gelatinilytica TaxID=1703343 RepID=A0A370QJN1_9FLAO|nr:glycosyltransferase family 9 protein [Marinirhabdus gelatinilytica]RDK88539.1 ADP-heptose:LPS heptosyltransferase [Marinirhabdus gelatinilytica]